MAGGAACGLWVVGGGGGCGPCRFGTAFYLYMAVAGMTLPAHAIGLNRGPWKDFHAFQRAANTRKSIRPSGTGDNLVIQRSTSSHLREAVWIYLDGLRE